MITSATMRPPIERHHLLAAGQRQELVQDQPLVVPPDNPLRLSQDLGNCDQRTEIGTDVSDNPIVKAEQRQVQLRNDMRGTEAMLIPGPHCRGLRR